MAVTITDASLQGIYNRLHAIPEYHPLDAQTFADWSVEAGDVVTVSRENDSYSSPVHTSRMVWKGSPETQLTSGGNKQRDPVSTVSQKKYRRGSAAQRSQEIIQSTLEDEVGGVRSTVTQLANQWSVVVEGTGQNAHIKPAVMQASIDAATGQSKLFLSADNIILDGDAVADAIQSQNIRVQQLTVDGDLIVEEQGKITAYDIEVGYAQFGELYVGEEDYNKLNIYDVSISGNRLTVYYVDGTSKNFSKAVTLTGAWNSAYNVRAGKTFTVTATMNGSWVGGEGIEIADGTAVASISPSVGGSWNGNVYTGKIAKLLDDGTYDATGLIYQVDATDKLQQKTVTPTGSQQTVTPDNGYIGLSSVIVNAGGGGSGTITTVTGTAIAAYQTAYSGTITVDGTNITNAPYTIDIGIEHNTFQPQSGSAQPCVNVKYGNTIIARQDVTVSATAPTFTYNSTTHNYTASAQGEVWSTAYGNAVTNNSGTEAYEAGWDDCAAGTLESDPGPIVPTTENQVITPSDDYIGLEQVTVQGSTNLVGANIKNGTAIFGVTGIYPQLSDIDIYRWDYKSDSEPSSSFNSLPTKANVDVPLVINKKDAWYQLAIDVGTGAYVRRKWYKVHIEIDGKNNLVSGNIKDGITICGVKGNFSGFTTNKTVTRVFCDVTSSGMKKSGKLYRYNENTKRYVAVVNSDKYWFYCSDTLDTSTNGGTRKVYYDA